jgi:hypothetical protein
LNRKLVCKDGQILVKDRQLLWESAPVTDIPYGFHAAETFVPCDAFQIHGWRGKGSM